MDFDYHTYLHTLRAQNLTLTQTWTGSYVEPDSDCGPFNTLDPKPVFQYYRTSTERLAACFTLCMRSF